MTDAKLLELLQGLHGRLLSRYGAPGVCLDGFKGRWLVFCSTELGAGLERALIDAESLHDEMVQGSEELDAIARIVVGEENQALIVAIEWVESADATGQAVRPLSVVAWSPDEPVLLSGCIAVDGAGRPFAVLKSGAIVRRGGSGAG
jgi:hypothetical protein